MKRTLYFNGPDRSRAILGQSDTTVYVLHPDSPKQILEIPHQAVEAASATFTKVRREYFHARIGFHLDRELDSIDHDRWIFKWTPEEEAFHLLVAEARRGYRKVGTQMAMSVYNVDIETVLPNADDATLLHVLIGIEDNVDKHRRTPLLNRLAKGAAPIVTELIFESPWFTSLREFPLKLPAKLVERVQRLAAVGTDAWPVHAKPRNLTHLRLDTTLTPEIVESIADVRSLRVLQLAATRKSQTAVRALLAHTYEELELWGLDDLADMVDALIAAKQRPATVRLSGSVRRGTSLRSAIERWRRESGGTALQLHTFDDDGHDAIAAAGLTSSPSSYSTSYTPEHRALIAPFQPSNYSGTWKA